MHAKTLILALCVLAAPTFAQQEPSGASASRCLALCVAGALKSVSSAPCTNRKLAQGFDKCLEGEQCPETEQFTGKWKDVCTEAVAQIGPLSGPPASSGSSSTGSTRTEASTGQDTEAGSSSSSASAEGQKAAAENFGFKAAPLSIVGIASYLVVSYLI